MEKRKDVRPSADPVEELLDALVPVAFILMATLNKVGADNDLSLTLMRVLGILRDRRPRMTALADYLGLKKSTMAGLIDRAEQRGLVARAPSAEDARAIDVFLTRAGAKLVEQLRSRIADELTPMANALNASEQRRLTELLQRLLESREGERPSH